MSLPQDFLSLMRRQLGDAEADALCEALVASEPAVSVRLNPLKAAQLDAGALSPVPWCPMGYYLDERPAFTFDPLFHAGAYYVQEASSMFLHQVLVQHLPAAPLVALDLCAAPGGKSTLLRAELPEGSLLVSNEPDRKRAQILAENITKWGHPDCVVSQAYPADFARFIDTFDLVVVDAPCSGEGMFRKDEQAVEDWSLANVDQCWRRQRDIVQTIWPTLKAGALMVYSTCTFNRFEDEDNVRWMAETLGAEVLPVALDASWGVVEGEPGYHFFPHRTRGEGFYLAVLRKKGEHVPDVEYKRGEPVVLTEAGHRYALPVGHEALVKRLRRMVRCLVSGVEVETLKGCDWVPAHALALSTLLAGYPYPRFALTLPEAVAYLRREALRIDAPRGYVVVTYRDLPLGFVKSVGGRANNLYPADWRIRTTYTKEAHVF